MQLLKSLVIGLGFLILLALTLLAYGFYLKARDPGWRLFSPSPPAGLTVTAPALPTRPAPKTFGSLDLRLPEGCVIDSLRPDGERLYLTIGPAGPCHRVIVVDVGQGRVLGTIRPRP